MQENLQEFFLKFGADIERLITMHLYWTSLADEEFIKVLEGKYHLTPATFWKVRGFLFTEATLTDDYGILRELFKGFGIMKEMINRGQTFAHLG